MSSSDFLRQIAITTAIVVTLLLGLSTLLNIQPYWEFSLFTLLFFLLLSVAIFYLGKRTARSANLNDFSRLALAFIFIKMMLCVVLVVIYNQVFQPESRLFLLPFFMIYLAYTILETACLMKLAGDNKPQSQAL